MNVSYACRVLEGKFIDNGHKIDPESGESGNAIMVVDAGGGLRVIALRPSQE